MYTWLPFIFILISFGLSTTEDIGDDVSVASMVTEIIPSKTLPSNEADPTLTEDLQKNVDYSSVLLFSSSSPVAAAEYSSTTTQTQEAISSSTPELIETSYVEPITEQQRTNQTSELKPLETISTVFIKLSHDSVTSETQEVSVLEKFVTEQIMQSDVYTSVTSPVSQILSDMPVDITQTHSEEVSIIQFQSEEVSITQSQSEEVSITQSQSKEVSITQSQSEEVSITQSAFPEEPSGIHGKVLLDEKVIISEEIAQPKKTGEEPVNTGADKPEDFPSFNEWLAEQEKTKHNVKPEGDKKHLKQGRRGNYASRECGAKILASNSEAINAKSILNSNKDEYMINPCKAKKWFDLELCEPVQFQSVEIASLEMFSSQPKTFKLYISDRYPAKDWRAVGDFHMSEARSPQNFPVTGINEFYAKFVRVELLEHYGDEHFCPVTFFRVYGIAVYEDDDDDVDTQRTTMEEDEELFVTGELSSQEEDGGVDVKKLLASAKDTVINIVKKVLKVDEKEEAYRNGTTEGFDPRNEMHNASSLNDSSHMLPCVPEVRISERNMSIENESMKQREPQPQPPYAFIPEGSYEQVNKLPIVTKLEDNEQIPSETLKIPVTSDIVMLDLDLSHAVIHCFSCGKADVLDFGRQTSLTKFCAYVVLLLGKHLVKTSKQDDDSTKFDFILIESSIQSETIAIVQPGSVSESEISVIVPVEVKPLTQSDSTLTTPTMSEESPTVTVTDISTEEVVKSSVSESVEDAIKTVSQISETLNIFSSIPTSSVSFSTKINESTLQTSSNVMVSESSREILSSQASESLSTSISELVSDAPLVEPSATGLPINTECNLESTVLKTPSLVDVKDTLKPDTDIVDSFVQESFASKQTEQVKDDKPLPEVTSPVIQPTEPITPSIIIAMEPTHLDLPTVPSGEAPVHSSSDFDKAKLNVTEIPTGLEPEKKAAVDLELVKVPVMPASKRESAIMRLSNRIKVLEQNVTLSSLFLDALSKRFKKQSEEMMKMLNKTFAKLSNETLISAAKDQMQEERIYILEEEVRNLTKTVNDLTKDLDTLNQQVKDRQMIWTTIEIIIIVVILIITNLRGRKSNLSPEIQKLIDSMPTKPLPPTSHRRNSYSGPVTPSKHKDKHAGTLHKYRSETALAASDFPIVEPLFSSSTQIKEGQKRKKKKKQRSMDFKFSALLTEDRPLIEGQEWQSNCPGYYRRDSDQSSTKSSRCGEPNVLTGYYNRNVVQTNLSLGGHKMFPKPPSNPKVQLRECKTSPNLQTGFNISSCDCKQQSKSASQSRRNSHDLQSMKMKDIPGPPMTLVPTQITINPSDLGQRRHVRIQNQNDSKTRNSQGHGSEVKYLCDSHCQDYYDSHLNGIQNVKMNGFLQDCEVCNQSHYYNNSKGKFSPYPLEFTAQNGNSETDFNGFHGNGHDIHDYILDDLCNVAHSSEKEIINASKDKSVRTSIWKKVFG
ncbi:hypothetical protein CHS0354_036037 [Potamilus streckersoni]|uniref:SUN domain-containing protein n=1 Tax=Potamilus streckersoni TaxID=2493646 RepID=A0AAE0TEY3_9BIVA|nr:hypothetical protein CHS0354_036037 [Potamilus streckersoni]